MQFPLFWGIFWEWFSAVFASSFAWNSYRIVCHKGYAVWCKTRNSDFNIWVSSCGISLCSHLDMSPDCRNQTSLLHRFGPPQVFHLLRNPHAFLLSSRLQALASKIHKYTPSQTSSLRTDSKRTGPFGFPCCHKGYTAQSILRGFSSRYHCWWDWPPRLCNEFTRSYHRFAHQPHATLFPRDFGGFSPQKVLHGTDQPVLIPCSRQLYHPAGVSDFRTFALTIAFVSAAVVVAGRLLLKAPSTPPPPGGGMGGFWPSVWVCFGFLDPWGGSTMKIFGENLWAFYIETYRSWGRRRKNFDGFSIP